MKFSALATLSLISLASSAAIEQRAPAADPAPVPAAIAAPDAELAELSERSNKPLTAIKVTGSINAIAELSLDLTKVAKSITLGPLGLPLGAGGFGNLVVGFQKIITTATGALKGTSKPSKSFTKGEQQEVCKAFRNFVKIHQELLDVVIGKGGILTLLGGAPVAAVLRVLEGVVDTIALQIISLVPTCSKGAKADLAALDKKIRSAQCVYTPLGTILPIFCPKKKTSTDGSSGKGGASGNGGILGGSIGASVIGGGALEGVGIHL
ncbi:hypothetical protein B0O99DRAFT_745433 [Bisporella sp. PMI_857]|nr:hypothetical protein B0O99DRAFT_745433 [Bisporella sp. PMI_857]